MIIRFSSEALNLAVPSFPENDTQRPDYLQEMRSEDRSYDAPPTAVGLNDSFRPSMDSFSVSEQPLPPPNQISTSYDDLRRQNRDDFEQKRMEAYKRQDGFRTSPNPTPQPSYQAAQRGPSVVGSSSNKKNEYGDVWEE